MPILALFALSGCGPSGLPRDAVRESNQAQAVIDHLRSQYQVSARVPLVASAAVQRIALLAPSSVQAFQRSANGPLQAFMQREEDRLSSKSAVEIPAQASGALHFKDLATGVDLLATIRGTTAAAAEIGRGYVVYRSGYDGNAIVRGVSATGIEDFIAFDVAPAQPEVVYDVRFGTAVAGLRLVGNTLEFLDYRGTPRLRVSPPRLLGASGDWYAATISVTGCAVDTSSAAPWGRTPTSPGSTECAVHVNWAGAGVRYPALLDPGWETTLPMNVARLNHTAVSLPSGRVLVVGGEDSSFLASAAAEIFDPITSTWSATDSMTSARVFLAATVLANGTVFVADGLADGAGTIASTPEIFDPATGHWTQTTACDGGAYESTASLVTVNGSPQVLLAGGVGRNNKAFLFDPATKSCNATGSMAHSRNGHTATVLPSGKVFVVGGGDATTELYDPSAGTWSTTASLDNRFGHISQLLQDGTVLVAGGHVTAQESLASASVYDPNSDQWTSINPMTAPRNAATASIRPNGDVLVAGGLAPRTNFSDPVVALSSAEVYASGNWQATSAMNSPRGSHTQTTLSDGRVLVAGGDCGSSCNPRVLGSAEVFDVSVGIGPIQCGQCGDGVCNGNETPCSCAQDCPDTDGDGLADAWETSGIDNNCDGTIDLDLPGLGANPNHKDLFLALDYMDCTVAGSDCAAGDTHNHKPDPNAIADVINVYADANNAHSISNPDGQPGVTLHVTVDHALPHRNTITPKISPNPATCEGPSFINFYGLKAGHFDPARTLAYRYGIFAHFHTCDSPTDCAKCPGTPPPPFGSSGLSPTVPGSDLIVSLGAFSGGTGTRAQQAATLLHEFGHNVGLQHGGNIPTNFKPNYLSVMNYLFQFSNILDYSIKALPTLDETTLDETVGIQDTTNTTRYSCPPIANALTCDSTGNCPGSGTSGQSCGGTCTAGTKSCPLSMVGIGNGTGAIDWNCDGTPTNKSVAVDLNQDCTQNKLAGFADWSNLYYPICAKMAGGSGAAPGPNDLDYQTAFDNHLLFPFEIPSTKLEPSQCIGLGDPGVVTAAVLSSSSFDATQITQASLILAGSFAVGTGVRDVDGDGIADLEAQFPVAGMNISQQSTTVLLNGALPSSQAVIAHAPVTVVQRPVATCANVIVPADGTCHANASIDAGSYDPDGTPVTLTQDPPGPYGLGTTTVTLTAHKTGVCSTVSDSCTATVTVKDVTPPVITPISGPDGFAASLQPPDHKYSAMTLADCVAAVVDNCDGVIPLSAGSVNVVTSDESEASAGSGNTCLDAVISSASDSFEVRREREGGGNGRVYAAGYDYHDTAGNKAFGTCKVAVAANQSMPAVDDGCRYCIARNPADCGACPQHDPTCR